MNNNVDYKFKSDLVKKVLPMGTTHISHIKREEVSPILTQLKEVASKDQSIKMFVICRIGAEGAWSEESILYELKLLREDITVLKWKLTQ